MVPFVRNLESTEFCWSCSSNLRFNLDYYIHIIQWEKNSKVDKILQKTTSRRIQPKNNNHKCLSWLKYNSGKLFWRNLTNKQMTTPKNTPVNTLSSRVLPNNRRWNHLRDCWWNAVLMSHLPGTHRKTHFNELWTHLLFSLFGISLRSQCYVLPMPYFTQSNHLYWFSLRLEHDQSVVFILFRVLVPRSKEIIKYLCRTTDTVEWIKRREIKNVKIGTILDFQDDNKVWRKAIVVKIF